MVKTILSFILFLHLYTFSAAQSFKVENNYVSLQGNITEEISPPATLRNLSRQPIILHWEVSKKSLPEGWTMMVNDRYVADKGIITLAGSEVFPDFKVNFQPNGFSGIGTVDIVLFDPNQRTATETEMTFTAAASSLPSMATLATSGDVPQVFPNPATDYVSLGGASAGTVKRLEIFNIVGRKVLDFIVGGDSERYDVSALPRGMYLVRLMDASGNILRTQRISKYNP